MTTSEVDSIVGFGAQRFHAENRVGGLVKRTARWAAVVLVAVALVVFVLLDISDARPGDGWRPGFLLAPVGGLGLLWGVFESFGLISRWWRVGLAIDVFDGGLVDEALEALRAERTVVFPWKYGTSAGPSVTARGLRLDDGREFEYSSLNSCRGHLLGFHVEPMAHNRSDRAPGKRCDVVAIRH